MPNHLRNDQVALLWNRIPKRRRFQLGKIAVQFIYFRFPNHSSFSGYARLVDYLCERSDLQLQERRISLGQCVRAPLAIRLADYLGRMELPKYGPLDALAEVSAFCHGLISHHQIFHLLYGEFSYKYLGFLDGIRGNRVVATFHTPVSQMSSSIKGNKHIHDLTAVITVSSGQVDYFASILGSFERVFWVPHGVDIDFFKPDPTVPQDIDCIVVGNHLRDLESLFDILEYISRIPNRLKILIISKRITNSIENLEKLCFFHNVNCISDVSDTELLNYYQRSRLLLLPLMDATANNTLLEAMACGLPVVSNCIPGVLDYVDSHCASLFHVGDSESMSEGLIDILNDEARTERMSSAARLRAEQFSWKIIANQMISVYRSISEID